MDIKQLNYFMAVAQAGSFSKAAENLTVSQPTLSVSSEHGLAYSILSLI